jgi:hypothetical protein
MAIKIKLWADYGSYPIWVVDEIDNIAPEELPLSQPTIQRLNAWQDTYDQFDALLAEAQEIHNESLSGWLFS